MTGNGWNEHQALVLHRLDEQERRLGDIDKRLAGMERLVIRHAERMAMAGAGMGLLVGLAPTVVNWLTAGG
mgnify:CR=1 FL=1|tara:strand:+ start:10794 stop:11006 length:213 start_codon:yes stop_codon:yes gene_type:complete